jgi:hypothetical protein
LPFLDAGLVVVVVVFFCFFCFFSCFCFGHETEAADSIFYSRTSMKLPSRNGAEERYWQVLGRHRLQDFVGGDHLRKGKVKRGQVGRVHIPTREREHRQD